ncbi:MAG: type IV secretory system conjugative DNA transfer family protein [Rhodospirillales bacterium]|nr:type IV secretory system conjugative DNA transfer family protein [Acetobacter sp.]
MVRFVVRHDGWEQVLDPRAVLSSRRFIADDEVGSDQRRRPARHTPQWHQAARLLLNRLTTAYPDRSAEPGNCEASQMVHRHLTNLHQAALEDPETILAMDVWLPRRGRCVVGLKQVADQLGPGDVDGAAVDSDMGPLLVGAGSAPILEGDVADPDRPASPAYRSWDADSDRWRAYRLPLGKDAAGSIIWSKPWSSVLVPSGAPRSGKTTQVVLGIIASFPGSVLVLSARPDVLESTYRNRARRGKVEVFNPSGFTTALRSAKYDLLHGARTWKGARRLAEHIVKAAVTGGITDAHFWWTKAAQLLGPLLLAAGANGLSMVDVLRWVKTGEEFEVRALLAAIPGRDGELAMQSFDAIMGLEDRTRSAICTTLDAALAVFELEEVSSAIGAGFDDQFLVCDDDQAATLYAIAPATEQAAVAPIMTLIIARALRAAVEHHLATGGPARLLVVIDEAGNLGHLDQLAELTTTAAGCGITLVTIWHGLSQLEKIYGEHDAATIVDQSPNLIFLRGSSRSSAALLASLSPDMAPHEGLRQLRNIPAGHAILMRDQGDPHQVQLLATWRDPDLDAALEI